MSLLISYIQPWTVASLLSITPFFSQTQDCVKKPAKQQQCEPLIQCQETTFQPPIQASTQPTYAGYNAPAEINTGYEGDINFFVSGSFLFWQPLQDNMVVASVFNNSQPDLTATYQNATNGQVFNANCLEFDYKYKPGFQVTLGMNLQDDNWVGYGEYTRVHGTHTISSHGPSGGAGIVSTTDTENGEIYSTVSANFTCNLDFADAILERVYYIGRNLVIHSAFGGRGAWITESLITHYRDGTTSTPGTASNLSLKYTEDNVTQRVRSWGVGPRGGAELDWDLGAGVRYFGNAFLDVLYTNYKVQHRNTPTIQIINTGSTTVLEHVTSLATKDIIHTLRTHVDTEIGLGWGFYSKNKGWHFDFSGSYGFQVFFNQNMFSSSTLAPIHNGNLYIHGATATMRLDF